MTPLTPHLIINFEFLHDAKLQKHPQGGGDHGIVVQGKVIKVELIDPELTAQGDLSGLGKEKGQFQ